MAHAYNDPAGGIQSTVGPQFNTFFHDKRSLIEAKKEMYFSQMASTRHMPKHFGKTIKLYHYMPMLDDRNLNDQGIDANGVTIVKSGFYVTLPALVTSFVAEADATAAAAAINAIKAGAAVKAGSATPWTVTVTDTKLPSATEILANAAVAAVKGAKVKVGSGNLYGSSKDVGTVLGQLPLLGEHGGRVNRVGSTRVELEGSIQKFGFFQEVTQESLDFDTDEQLYAHMSREMVQGAVQLTEAVLQVDLLHAAGVIAYTGAATNNVTVDPDHATAPSLVTYEDLQRLSITLNNNRTPKQTKIITGSRMIDTATISSGRVMYVGSELEILLRGMVDQFENPAFIPVHKYGAAGTLLTGEIGSVGDFRVVVVPEMLHWAGEGAAATGSTNFRSTGGRYDIFPMLVIGDESFATIGFQTDGKTVKFKIITKMPGEKNADFNDPFGEKGFSSIKWYYGFLKLRGERIAVIKTGAPI